MLELLKKEAVMDHVQQTLTMVEVQDAELVETMDEDGMEINVWLVSVDTGEEYWVLEGDIPMHMFHKGGIHQTPQRVVDTYLELMEQNAQQKEQPDRFHQDLYKS